MIHKKYRVHSTVMVEEGKWNVVYAVWVGCYCNHKIRDVVIESDKNPNLSLIIAHEKSLE